MQKVNVHLKGNNVMSMLHTNPCSDNVAKNIAVQCIVPPHQLESDTPDKKETLN